MRPAARCVCPSVYVPGHACVASKLPTPAICMRMKVSPQSMPAPPAPVEALVDELLLLVAVDGDEPPAPVDEVDDASALEVVEVELSCGVTVDPQAMSRAEKRIK